MSSNDGIIQIDVLGALSLFATEDISLNTMVRRWWGCSLNQRRMVWLENEGLCLEFYVTTWWLCHWTVTMKLEQKIL